MSTARGYPIEWPRGFEAHHTHAVVTREIGTHRLITIFATGNARSAESKRDKAMQLPRMHTHTLTIESVIELAAEAGLPLPTPPDGTSRDHRND